MKHLLTLLLKRSDTPPWWEIRSSEGDPPNERKGLHFLEPLLTVIRRKLNRIRSQYETTEKTD